MNGKWAFVFALTGTIVLMTPGCTGGKYKDLVEANTQFVTAMEDYLDATEKATTAHDMAQAINDYADQIETLAPRIKEVRVKYPGLETATDIPEELKTLSERSRDLEQKIVVSYMNMMKFIMDPGVQAARQKLLNAMEKMQ